jgi:hypothetical protein
VFSDLEIGQLQRSPILVLGHCLEFFVPHEQSRLQAPGRALTQPLTTAQLSPPTARRSTSPKANALPPCTSSAAPALPPPMLRPARPKLARGQCPVVARPELARGRCPITAWPELGCSGSGSFSSTASALPFFLPTVPPHFSSTVTSGTVFRSLVFGCCFWVRFATVDLYGEIYQHFWI